LKGKRKKGAYPDRKWGVGGSTRKGGILFGGRRNQDGGGEKTNRKGLKPGKGEGSKGKGPAEAAAGHGGKNGKRGMRKAGGTVGGKGRKVEENVVSSLGNSVAWTGAEKRALVWRTRKQVAWDRTDGGRFGGGRTEKDWWKEGGRWGG